MRGAALAATLALALLAGCGLEQDVADRNLAPASRVAAPELRGDLVGGGSFDLAAERGHPVVLAFFASWCGPCVAEQPALDAVARRYLPRVAFVGIDMGEGAAQARGYLASLHVPYGAIVDSDGSLASAYGVAAPPSMVVVGPDGRVAASWIGGADLGRLGKELDSLLAVGAPPG